MSCITVTLNDKIQPIDRGDVYEDPLDEWLKSKNYGEVTGAGTHLTESGEITGCDLEIFLSGGNDPHVISQMIAKLEEWGAPKGSKLTIEESEKEIAFGKKEGLGIYLNGESLDPEVYQNCDINVVLSELQRLTNCEEEVARFWEGGSETALFFYGPSFAHMKNEISKFITTYPLCKDAKVVQIA